MRVLIVGGTGLISTAISRVLAGRGVDLSHFNRGERPVRLPENLPRPKVVKGDRKDFPAFERQIAELCEKDGPFDAVIDMVAYLPEETESAIRAFRGRTRHFIFTSTVDAYLKPPRSFPIKERDPIGGLTVYGQAKARCEEIALAAHARGDLPVTIIRPAMTYGEGGQLLDLFGWGSAFVDRMLRGMPIIGHGDGQSFWTCCHIDDAALAFANGAGNPATFGKAYNVTGETWHTFNQYYEAIAEGVGAPQPDLVYIPTTLLHQALPRKARECLQNFQFDNIFDTGAARRDLGFAQTIDVREGARRTYRWLVENGRAQKAEDAPIYDRLIAMWKKHAAAFAEEARALDA
jgi:nucleoside-diphosphate-sugar epimerase